MMGVVEVAGAASEIAMDVTFPEYQFERTELEPSAEQRGGASEQLADAASSEQAVLP